MTTTKSEKHRILILHWSISMYRVHAKTYSFILNQRNVGLHVCRTLKPVTLGCKGTNDCFMPRNFSLLSNLRALSGYTEKLILPVKFSVVTELWGHYRVNFILFLGELQLEKSFQAGFCFVLFFPGDCSCHCFVFPLRKTM